MDREIETYNIKGFSWTGGNVTDHETHVILHGPQPLLRLLDCQRIGVTRGQLHTYGLPFMEVTTEPTSNVENTRTHQDRILYEPPLEKVVMFADLVHGSYRIMVCFPYLKIVGVYSI